MNKTILKTTTILAIVSLSNLTYAIPSKGAGLSAPNIDSSSQNNVSTERMRLGSVHQTPNSIKINNDQDISEVNIVSDRIEIKSDVINLESNKTNNSIYDVVDAKTDQIDSTTDTVNAIQNQRPKLAKKKQGFFSKLFRGATKNESLKPTETIN